MNRLVKLGDNHIIETELEVVPLEIDVYGLSEVCEFVASTTPYRMNLTTSSVFHYLRIHSRRLTGEIDESNEQVRIICAGNEQARFVNRSRKVERRLHCASEICIGDRPIGAKARFMSKRRDGNGCDIRAGPSVVREQQQQSSAGKCSVMNGDSESSKRGGTVGSVEVSSSTKGKDSIVDKMFTMGIVDKVGKLKKFLKLKTKSIEDLDFMLVLSNETIERVAHILQRQDQPTSVLTENVQ
ncbi:hypothetical protein PHPALM_30557 [Phytophthora palmivora]|uniref:Uncharacterized protein n=1 Tax=Phytophthora palmivora TaxID=4796 RepID=A0A2P4X4U0_9STRA|nr:hypothetical protein PHPALM_30557 [Phytophthora palmivora]